MEVRQEEYLPDFKKKVMLRSKFSNHVHQFRASPSRKGLIISASVSY